MADFSLTALGIPEKKARRIESFLEDNKTGLLAALAVVVTASIGVSFLSIRSHSREDREWAAYAAAARDDRSAQELERTARDFVGSSVEPWALITAATQYAQEDDLDKASSLAGEVKTRFGSHFLSSSNIFASISPVESLERYLESRGADLEAEKSLPPPDGKALSVDLGGDLLEVTLFSASQTIADALWGTDGSKLLSAHFDTFAPSGICFGKLEVSAGPTREQLRDAALTSYQNNIYHRSGSLYVRVPTPPSPEAPAGEAPVELDWGICFADYPGLDGNAVPLGVVTNKTADELSELFSSLEPPAGANAGEQAKESISVRSIRPR